MSEMLRTHRQYPCGCSATGPGDVPAYCPEHGKPSLKVVTKPEGWDLRNARAMKTDDATLWQCGDVLFDAQELMKKFPPTVAAVVVWYTRNPNGSISLKYTCAQEHERQIVALATDFMTEIAAGGSTE